MLEGVEIRLRQCCRRTLEDSRFVHGNFKARLSCRVLEADLSSRIPDKFKS